MLITMVLVTSTTKSMTVGVAQKLVTVAVHNEADWVVMEAGTMRTLLSVMLIVRSGTGTSIARAGCSKANVYNPADCILVLVAQTATVLIVLSGK